MQQKADGQEQVYQADSLTVTKSKENYDICKRNTFEAVKNFKTYCWIWLIIAFVILIIEISTLSTNCKIPMINSVSVCAFHQKSNNPLNTPRLILLVLTIIYWILAIVPFILSRCMGLACSVHTSKRTVKLMKINGIAFLNIPIISIACTIWDLYSNLGPLLLALFFHVLMGCSTLAFIYYTYLSSIRCYESVLNFHDFLINYRQTPRSKILRKHLPSMEAVVEEASMYEQSMISLQKSQSNISNSNTIVSHLTKST